MPSSGATVMAHTSRCSNARTDRSRCKCSCDGNLHGGNASLIRIAVPSPVASQTSSPVLRPAGTWSKIKRRAGGRSRSKRRAAMSLAQTELDDWLATAAADYPGNVSAVTEQTVGMVSDAVASAVVKALNRNGYHWTGADHVICDFLAAAARAMQELQDQFEHAVAHMVSALLTARKKEHRPVIPQPLATVAAQAAVNELMKLPAIGHFDDLLRATRILAIMMCPAPEDHRAVVLYCLSPLEQEIISDVTRQELRESLPRGWINSKPTPIN
jgi:hypothetical protein